MESWKASFLRAGVYCEKEPVTNGDDLADLEYAAADPHLEREVETIRNLVKSYVKIVSKTFKDMVPKYLTKMVINSMKEFIVGDTLYILLNDLYATGDQSTLMEMSAEEEKRKEDILRLYNAITNALKKINDTSMKTTYAEIPPPIRTNDFDRMTTRNDQRNGYGPTGATSTYNGHANGNLASNMNSNLNSNYSSRPTYENNKPNHMMNGNARGEHILRPTPAPQQPLRPTPMPNKPVVPSRAAPQINGNNVQNKLQPPLIPSRPAPKKN